MSTADRDGEPSRPARDRHRPCTRRALGFADARRRTPGRALVAATPGSKVGAVADRRRRSHVAPKVPIDRLFFLLGYAWTRAAGATETVDVAERRDLLPALAEAFERQATRRCEQGLLQGYRAIDGCVCRCVRGRIREADQISRRFGLRRAGGGRVRRLHRRHRREPSPARCRRRVCCGCPACRRTCATGCSIRALAGRRHPARRGRHCPRWQPSRLNARYQHALHLAEIVLEASSFEHTAGGLRMTGFLFDMAKVFEDFVTAALREAVPMAGGTAAGPRTAHHLDEAAGIAHEARSRLVRATGARRQPSSTPSTRPRSPRAFPTPTSTRCWPTAPPWASAVTSSTRRATGRSAPRGAACWGRHRLPCPRPGPEPSVLLEQGAALALDIDGAVQISRPRLRGGPEMPSAISYLPEGRDDLRCVLQYLQGVAAKPSRSNKESAEPSSVEGNDHLQENPALINNLRALGLHSNQYRRLRAEEKRESHRKQAEHHEKVARRLGDLTDAGAPSRLKVGVPAASS